MVTQISKFRCDVCGTIYSTEEEAFECEEQVIAEPKMKIGDIIYIKPFCEYQYTPFGLFKTQIRTKIDFIEDEILDIKKIGHTYKYITNGWYGSDTYDNHNSPTYLDDETIKVIYEWVEEFITFKKPDDKINNVIKAEKNKFYVCWT